MDQPTAKPCTNTQCDQQNPQPLEAFARLKAGKYGRAARCKSCTNARQRKDYAADPAPAKARAAAAYVANPEPVKARRRAAYWNDPAADQERVRQWRINNPAAWQASYLKSNSKRRATLLGATVGEIDYAAVKALRPDCYLCGQQLGNDVHADHVTPLARGGAHHVTNLLPTHPECNRRKGDKLLAELPWYKGS